MSVSRRGRAGWVAVALVAALVALVVTSVRIGTTSALPDLGACARGLAATIGLADALPGSGQTIVELRLWRALTAAGVGAGLGLSGALVQGVFRNGLASPSVLGISGGASLGAIAALMFVGGYGPQLMTDPSSSWGAQMPIPICALLGALIVTFVVFRLASSQGRVSVPALLLVGLAMNTFLGGVQQLVQMLVVEDGDISKSILLWTFGTLNDRQPWHAGVAWSGALLAAAVIPFVAWELDLMQPSLEDAEAQGVDTARVKVIVLVAASLSAATAVSVAGQIAFVGLIVPHLIRLATGPSHRTLLALSGLGGATFLLLADVASRVLFPRLALQPGVVMSLVGGPFFIWLLWTKRREIVVW